MYQIHDLANIVAMASEQEQAALTNDISTNGQEDAAVLWQGKIVDGRCRQLACMSLGIELKTRGLDPTLPEDRVALVVKSLNTRRNLTMTQKVVSAYKQQLRTNETNKVIAEQWAISVPTLKNCKYVAQHASGYIDPLFNGKAIQILNKKKGLMVTTNRINTIAKLLKDNADNDTYVIDTSFEKQVKYSVDELPLSSKLYEWYATKLGEFSRLTPEGKEMMMKAILFELAEYKEVQNDQPN